MAIGFAVQWIGLFLFSAILMILFAGVLGSVSNAWIGRGAFALVSLPFYLPPLAVGLFFFSGRTKGFDPNDFGVFFLSLGLAVILLVFIGPRALGRIARPFPKHLLLFPLLLSLALVGWSLDWTHAMALGRLEADYQQMESRLAALSPPPPPPYENAVPLYNEARSLLADNFTNAFIRPEKSFSAETFPMEQARNLLEKNDPALEALRKAASKPRWYLPPSQDISNTYAVPYIGYRKLACLASVSSRANLLLGDHDQSRKDFWVMGSMSRQLRQYPLFLQLMLAGEIEWRRREALEFLLAYDKPGQKPYALGPEGEDWMEAFWKCVWGDELFFLRILKSTPFTESSKLGNFLYEIYFLPADLGAHEGLVSRLDLMMQMPVNYLPEKLWQDYEDFPEHGYGIQGALWFHGFDSYAARAMVAAANQRISALALAANAYFQDHGRYPETLDALVPDYLETVPINPFNGKPIALMRVSGGLRLHAPGNPDNASPLKPVDLYLGREAYEKFRVRGEPVES